MNGINESIGRTRGETNTMLRYAPKTTEDQFSTESTPLLVPRVRSAALYRVIALAEEPF
jgi:hypothetical protein